MPVSISGLNGLDEEGAKKSLGFIVSQVCYFAKETAPSGFLICDGSAISRTTYVDLFNEIGVIYGNGDGSTTFNLPNLLGEFIRGVDNAAGNDPDAGTRTDRGDGITGDNVGTKQNHAYEQKDISWALWNTLGTTQGESAAGAGSSTGTHTHSNLGTSTETRPRNVAMLPCIFTGV